VSLFGNLGIFYSTVIVVRRAPRITDVTLLLLVAGAALILLMAFAYHAESGLLNRPILYPVPAGWSGYPELAAVAVVQFGILVAALLAPNRPAQGVAAAGLVIVNLIELVFLYSRGSWPAVGVIIAVAAFGLARREQAFRLAVLAGLLVVLGAIAVVSNPTVRYLASVSIRGEQGRAQAPIGYSVSLAAPEARLLIWRRAGRMILDHPLGGVGLGNFRQVFKAKYGSNLGEDEGKDIHAHNLWLQQFAEAGIAGGLAYVGLWAAAVVLAWRNVRRNPRFVALALLLAISGMAASNVTTNMFYQTGGANGRLESLTWMLLGLAAAGAANARTPASGARSQPALRTDLPD
jgi:O-antigen ligase